MHQNTPEHAMIQESAHKLAQNMLRPNSARWELENCFPTEGLEALGKAGFMGLLLPEEYGGVACDYLSYVLAIEEIAWGDASCSTILSVHNSVGSLPILHYGNEWQKKEFLPKLASGAQLAAFCLTEAQAGSDAANLETRAEKKGNNYIINGTKQFITAGAEADLAIVFAVSNPKHPDPHQRLSAFIVPTKSPGYKVGRIEQKMGQTAAKTAQIIFDNLQLDQDLLLGPEGAGYKIALHNLEAGRLGIAAQAIGIARSAFEHSLSYAQQRHTFGKELIDHQAIGFKLADMATQLEAARQLLFYAIRLKEEKLPALKACAMAKMFASEMAEKVCHDAIQIHGGYGYLRDFSVEQLYRDVRVTTIYEGTSDIQRLIICKALKN